MKISLVRNTAIFLRVLQITHEIYTRVMRWGTRNNASLQQGFQYYYHKQHGHRPLMVTSAFVLVSDGFST